MERSCRGPGGALWGWEVERGLGAVLRLAPHPTTFGGEAGPHVEHGQEDPTPGWVWHVRPRRVRCAASDEDRASLALPVGRVGEQSHGTQPPVPARPTSSLPTQGPSGFRQVSQSSGWDTMRQAWVSGVTSRGPGVWKSPNQNDPTDSLKTEFSKRALQ